MAGYNFYRLALGVTGCLLFSTAIAQQPTIRQYQSGTGFFVTLSGYIVTNAHVVHGCKEAAIRGNMPEREAKIIAVDAKNDLALLQTTATPLDVAPVDTSARGPQPKDKVIVIGYPGEHAMTGQYLLKETEVLAANGPQGEAKWIQFKSAADHGNSGGPLLDKSGNVVGVVVAKSTLTTYDAASARQIAVQESDLAISLPVLIRFLEQNNVYFNRNPYIADYGTHYIESRAKSYTVNVLCAPDGQ